MPVAAGFSICAAAQGRDIPEYATGEIPLSPEEFARLPHTPAYRAFLPEHVDLSSRLPSIPDQGGQNSCVAWSVGYAARAYYVAAIENRDVKNLANVPSPAFIYDSIIEPGQCSAGARIPSALDLLKGGVPSMRDVPYNPRRCDPPTGMQLSLPRDFRVRDWFAVDPQSVDQVKGELATGNPVILSLRTTSAFQALRGGDVYSASSSGTRGWHAIVAVGYDEWRQAFRLANSWGTTWGDRGFAWVSYDVFRDPSRVSAAYVMRPVSNAPVPRPEISPVVVVPPPHKPPVLPGPAPAPEPKPKPAPAQFTGIECSKLTLVSQAEAMVVKGFVGSDEDLGKVRAQAAPHHWTVDVDVRPWPQCEALLTLDHQLSDSNAPKVRIIRERATLQTADFLKFEIETPNQPSFLHVAYIQADGSVVNLIQPDNLTLHKYAPRSKIVLGAGDEAEPRFRVTAPFGREMLIALAASSPVFGHSRPQKETEREFLSALRAELLSSPAPNAAPRTIGAAYDTIITAASAEPPTSPRTQ